MRPPRLTVAVLCALLALPGPANAADPLPDACTLLQALPPGTLPADTASFDLAQDRRGDDMHMTLCLAKDADDFPVASLTVRQSTSANALASAAQRDSMLSDLADTFGQPPTTTPLDMGEAAVWVNDIRQLMLWYREGHALLIVTANGPAPMTTAERIARAIVTAFP